VAATPRVAAAAARMGAARGLGTLAWLARSPARVAVLAAGARAIPGDSAIPGDGAIPGVRTAPAAVVPA
jgi:hypothetical protein